jgi:cytochrome P450
VAQETTHLRAKWGDADGRPFDLEQDAITLVLRIWVRALFGDETGGETERIMAAIAATHEFFEARSRSLLRAPRGLPTPSNRRFRRSFESLSEFFFTVIDRRRRDPRQEPDLLSALLQTHDRDTSERLTRRQLHDELLMLSLLGHKTTATTLAWTLYLLAQTPAVAERVRHEHEAVLGGRRPDLDDVAKLTYTRQVLDESMRLYPAAWLIGRVASEDDEIGGYHVPAKATVILSPYLLHRHADFWEQPDRFDPERFAAGRAAGRPRYVYLPFGEGERACVAGTFALTQLTLILAELLPHFQLRLVPGQTVKPRISVVLRPGRVPMTAHVRAASAVAPA